ncbi:mannose-6-phosphate isomerase, class I [Enterobacter ludwigii]
MSQPFYRMRNGIKNYAWGSRVALNHLFGLLNPDDQPQAEVWMGSHPAGCSEIETDTGLRSLQDLISQRPAEMLGACAGETAGQLPYLLKLLSAECALSLQVHPNKRQAEDGFARQGNLPGEDYTDANHKPELVFALTPFMAMNGFRPYQEIANHFLRLDAPALTSALSLFRNNLHAEGLKAFFTRLMALEPAEKEGVLTCLEARLACGVFAPVAPFIERLMRDYPGDIGALAPLYLHCITLAPGEAMFLRAGTLHAYVNGTAVEVMASSDNVLRAGLTPKNINVAELVRCTVFDETPADRLRMHPQREEGMQQYPIPVTDFRFSVIEHCEQQNIRTDRAQILLVLKGSATLSHAEGANMTLNAGQSAFIPAVTTLWTLTQRGQSCLVS